MVSGPIAGSFCPLILEDLPPDRIYYSGLYAGTDLFLPGDKRSSIFKQTYPPFLYSSVTTQIPLAKTSAPGLPLHKIKPPSITIKMRLPYPPAICLYRRHIRSQQSSYNTILTPYRLRLTFLTQDRIHRIRSQILPHYRPQLFLIDHVLHYPHRAHRNIKWGPRPIRPNTPHL